MKQSQNGLPRVRTKCSASPGKSQVSLSHWYGMQLKKSIYDMYYQGEQFHFKLERGEQ